MTHAPVTTADELLVLATGSYEHVLHDLAEPFRRASGRVLRLSIANAGGVMKKISANEPADVVMTSAAGIDELAALGRVDAASRVEVGRMRLGVAVRPDAAAPEIATTEGFRAALLAAPSVAYIDPKGGGTSGPYFVTLFGRLGVSAEIERKGILCPNGKTIVRTVASGEAALGLTQASELIGADGVRFAGYLPAELQLVSVYCAAVASHAGSPGAARDFIRFVTGREGTERFLASGWDAGAA